jgi:glutamine amidotransferase
MMIAIIDYGMGNLRSVCKAFEKVGHAAVITRDTATISSASHVVLPGVGAFKDCMKNLERYGLIDSVYNAIDSGKPFLGICLGLQLLFEESEEFGTHRGLGVIKGKVARFSADMTEEAQPSGDAKKPSVTLRHTDAILDREDEKKLKIPHMGWNNIVIKDSPPVLDGIQDNSFFYFVHSYYVVPEDDVVKATTTTYGIEFTSSIWKDNIFACQFHPEKSQTLGLKLLKNFGEQ